MKRYAVSLMVVMSFSGVVWGMHEGDEQSPATQKMSYLQDRMRRVAPIAVAVAQQKSHEVSATQPVPVATPRPTYAELYYEFPSGNSPVSYHGTFLPGRVSSPILRCP